MFLLIKNAIGAKPRPDITLSRGVGFTTSFRRLLESIGPQDAEQNIYHGIKYGITHADLLQVRAPKPLLISSTIRVFFSIQAAVETYQEVNKAYEAFGKEEYAGQTIDDAGHGFFNTITDIYDFFQDVLDIPGSPTEEDFDGFDPEDTQVTPTGQLSTSIGGDGTLIFMITLVGVKSSA